MPELPEVETVLRGLQRCALGRRIADIEILTPAVIAGPPEIFSEKIKGRSIVAFERKGKALAVRLKANGESRPDYLLIRLGMTGQIVVTSPDAVTLPHTHVKMALDGGVGEIRYRDVRRFGRLRYCTHDDLAGVFRSLGPDALSITEEQFSKALQGRRGSLKGWLLNQRIVAGLGNIYADEALFRARIHPQTAAGRLTRPSARRLFRAVQSVLRRAVELQGTSFRDYIDIEGRPGNFLPRLRVYQRTGKPCPRCGTLIRRITICGRSSHFCPLCQRPPCNR
jgi:formamidopyrimidine-DNA glycosylase